ncbi:Signal transducer regulating beta-lactamase production, contains metallopeptidase domain [Kaistella treverensis]|uniref:Signal transducer regulating beta-lactamase production, contains metallopeptidase domain n=1 Tax=Kaistella treverensis TaxID=631455 RepID=A0A1I3M3B9_9FLAO|nr:Signal transducer regulating beta-lactamase production, contains metallopeptidase domain [Kaistella treverensis]
MIPIIVKIILCSSFLIGFYFLFLEKERTLRFNRFFLLTALFFSYSIRFIGIPEIFPAKTSKILVFGETSQTVISASPKLLEANFINYWLLFYAVVSVFFLVKFIYSFIKIKRIQGEKLLFKNQNILLSEKIEVPFSFLNTIFLPLKQSKNSEIEEQIFLHEKCHVVEKHSFDLLLLEFLKIFSWFNPALFLYKKAMIANHEFLADEYVLKHNFNIRDYQKLILSEIRSLEKFELSHQFNFNNTKKRFIMMTTKNSPTAGLKKLAFLPVLAILALFFTKKINAQTTTNKVSEQKVSPEIKDIAIPEVKSIIPEVKIFEEKTSKIEEFPPVKMDTIRKKVSAPDNATVPPPPPPPSEFEQVLPQFPGGLNALRQAIGQTFDTSVIKNIEGLLKTTVFLSIDEKGKVTNVVAEGDNFAFNREAERATKFATNGKLFIPATEDGVPVKTAMKLPITMKFESAASMK